MASRQGYVRAPLDAAHLYANTTQRHEPSRETLAAFAYTTGTEVSRDLVLLSAGASARVAYCGPLRSASRVAQPWSLRVRAWVVAIGSFIVCGDARGGIKPRPNVFPNPLLHFHQGSRQIVIEQSFSSMAIWSGTASGFCCCNNSRSDKLVPTHFEGIRSVTSQFEK